MLDYSIDNLGKNNFEDEEEIYITPSKSAIDNFLQKLKDNNWLIFIPGLLYR